MNGDPRARRHALLSLGAALLFAALLRVPLAEIPLERDEGEYAYIGERWLAGEVPYRDAFDQKPPGVFLAYGAAIRALGRSASAIHWGAQIWSFGTIAAVWALARAAGGNAAGAAAGIFFSLLSADPGVVGNAANTEILLVLPATLSLLAALRARRSESRGWVLAAGLLAGVATLFKQVALTNALLSALIVAAGTRRRSSPAQVPQPVIPRPESSRPEDSPGPTGRKWRGFLIPFQKSGFGMTARDGDPDSPSANGRHSVNWRHLGWFVGGGALAWLPFVLWFVHAGAFREFWESVAGYNLGYALSMPLRLYLRNFTWTFGAILVLAWPAYLLAVFGLAKWISRPPRHRPVRILGAWLAASAAGVAIGGYFRDHYYIQALPAVAVFAALGARALADLAASRWRHFVFATALAVPLYYTVSLSSWYYLPGDPKAKSRDLYPANPFCISEEVGRFIAARTRPEDRVFILGSEPQILFHAHRRSATRFIFVYPLMVPTEKARQRQAELLAEVARSSPRVVVTVFVPTSFLGGKKSATDLFGATWQMLGDYRLVGLTLFDQDASTRFLVGAQARDAWNRSPMGYDRPIVGSLAIWERR